MFKYLIKKITYFFLKIIFGIFFLNKRYGALVSEYSQEIIESNTISIVHNNINLKFYINNQLTFFRAKTFSSKEPETLEWIESFKKDSVMWDIGSNVGIYSIYAAKTLCKSVYAFEPSVFNIETLTRNVILNNLESKISIIPIAVSNNQKVNFLNMSNTIKSGSMSAFGVDFGYDGKKIINEIKYKILGLSLDFMLKNLNLEQPDYIKIDVDGIEHIILSDAKDVLLNTKSILIEINDDFADQRENCENILKKNGFYLFKKEKGELTKNSNFKNSFNQIWVKK